MATSKKQKYFIEDEQLPSAFHTSILTRALSEQAMKGLWDSYKAARHVARSTQEPTEEQFRLATLAKSSGKSVKQIAQEQKIDQTKLAYAIRRVAVWEFMQ